MKTYPNTPAGMTAAQRAYDSREHPDFYDRRRVRPIVLRDGTEITEADVTPDPIDPENETEITDDTDDTEEQ